MSSLTTPLQIGSLQVGGRLFKAATSETRAAPDGTVTDELLAFYRPMADAGTPLIITGNLYVSMEGKSAHHQAGIDSDAALPGLRDWAEVIHDGGGKLFAQLNHAGRQVTAPAPGVAKAVSASAVRNLGQGSKPRPLRRDEIPAVVDSFASAAVRAQMAGMDGVQVQCGHGYLLSQFLSPHTNRRNDDYGGSAEGRMRLSLQVLAEVRRRVGADFPVIVKLNGTDALPRGGVSLEQQIRVALVMQDQGVDAIEISRGHFSSFASTMPGTFTGSMRAQVDYGGMRGVHPARRAAMKAFARPVEAVLNRAFQPHEGFNLPLAEVFRSRLTIPVIVGGGFRTPALMASAVNAGRCDAISVARAMIANPFLYRQVKRGEALSSTCTMCNRCLALAGGRPLGCYDPTIEGSLPWPIRPGGSHS